MTEPVNDSGLDQSWIRQQRATWLKPVFVGEAATLLLILT
jgi:hypothetical protein